MGETAAIFGGATNSAFTVPEGALTGARLLQDGRDPSGIGGDEPATT